MTERMTVLNNGRVGIGTPPSVALDVVGDATKSVGGTSWRPPQTSASRRTSGRWNPCGALPGIARRDV